MIERYLHAHPHAEDGVDGVVWWIPALALEPRALVLDALDLLVARGVVAKKERGDGTATYQLAPASPPRRGDGG